MHFYFRTFYLYAHQIVLPMYNIKNNSLMTRNVKLHYFSWNYHASNSLMQSTSFHSIYESISQRLNRAVYEFHGVFFVRMLVVVESKSEGARYSDVNEVMHIGRWRVFILAVRRAGCGFARCIVSLKEPGRQSWFVFFIVSPTMIKELATVYELASMKQADRTGCQTFSNALHEGFLTSCSVELWCLFVLPSVHRVACVSSASSCPEP